MAEFKSGFVAIIGRTNVGKSTLINKLVGEKVAITVNKSQTTRTAIRAIVNRENSQIIFIDTPGVHKPKTKLGETMLETAYEIAEDVDIILFIVDCSKKEITKGDRIILEKIKEINRKTILILNKIDLIQKEDILKVIDIYRKEYDFEEIIPISALNNKGVTTILDAIEKNLKPGPAYYDIDEYTDQTSRQLVEEVIREKALKFLSEEVPHGIAVSIDQMKARNRKLIDIDATIICERDSHKGIIIGKQGAMLKKIGSQARPEIEDMLGKKVNLKLWVKVKKDWRDSDFLIKNFGYDKKEY